MVKKSQEREFMYVFQGDEGFRSKNEGQAK